MRWGETSSGAGWVITATVQVNVAATGWGLAGEMKKR
jgi:hypothetical protein